MSELPETKEALIARISEGGSLPSSDPARQSARAKLDTMLLGELTSGLTQLTTGLTLAREEMRTASEAASRHAKALVFATWVLALLTGVLAVATVISLCK